MDLSIQGRPHRVCTPLAGERHAVDVRRHNDADQQGRDTVPILSGERPVGIVQPPVEGR